MSLSLKLSKRCTLVLSAHFLLLALHGQKETNALLIESGDDFTFERIDDTTFVWKKYDPESDFASELITYSTEAMGEKHGRYYQQGLNGSTTISQGRYFRNQKHGEWTENIYDTGHYQHGKREGTWYRFDRLDRLRVEFLYQDGQEIAKPIYYDSLGQVVSEEFHLAGRVRSFEEVMTYGTPPIFAHPELSSRMSQEEIKKASDITMLNWIYKRVRYPSEARTNGLEGLVVIRFIVDSDGSVYDAHVLRSVAPSLDQEALRVVNLMPTWHPGTVNGAPVKVQFNLPVRFQLE